MMVLGTPVEPEVWNSIVCTAEEMAADKVLGGEHGADKGVGDAAVVEGPAGGGLEERPGSDDQVEGLENHPGLRGFSGIPDGLGCEGMPPCAGDSLDQRGGEQGTSEGAPDNQSDEQGIEAHPEATFEQVDSPHARDGGWNAPGNRPPIG